MPEYFYSEVEPPYPHRVRCVPDDYEHDDGVNWIRAIYETLSMLDLEEDRDYTAPALTILQFKSYEHATAFEKTMNLNLGLNFVLAERL